MIENSVMKLKIASIAVIVFGVGVSLGVHPLTDGITRYLTDLAIWPLDGLQTLAAPETRFVLAVTGGITAGWGVLFWIIASRLYPKDPGLARSMILTSIWTWFVIDCIGSAIAGAPVNILLNIPFLLIFVIPLWRATEAPVNA